MEKLFNSILSLISITGTIGLVFVGVILFKLAFIKRSSSKNTGIRVNYIREDSSQRENLTITPAPSFD